MNQTQKVDIDALEPSTSLIDLAGVAEGVVDMALEGFSLKTLQDDIVMIKYSDADEGVDGDTNVIMRGGIAIPKNYSTDAWRIGVVILQGPAAEGTTVGDYVIFPNNMGIPIKNVEVEGQGVVTQGIFLNAQRIFGTLQRLEDT